MNPATKSYYWFRRIWKSIVLYLALAGPGIGRDDRRQRRGGITTYAATGAKYGYNLIWFLLLVPGRLLRAGNDRAPGRDHQARPCRGDFRRVRLVLGLVLADRPVHRGLADPRYRIRRHDLRDAHLSDPAMADGARRGAIDGLHRAQRPLLDLGEDRARLLPAQSDLHPRGTPRASAGQTVLPMGWCPIFRAASTAICSSS